MSQGKQMYYHYLRENIRNMHPKFKELAIQAGAYEDGNSILTGPMDVAKFAELIVRDCRGMFVVNSPSWNLLNEKLEHFGVEE